MNVTAARGLSVRTRVLRAAAALSGGPRKLRDLLQVRSSEMMAWLSGAEEPPRNVFLRAVHLVLDELERRRR
jgi:hypothetical protein